jgi:uncharacterized protein (TIGR02466 family)
MNFLPLFASPVGWDILDIDNAPIEEWCYKQEHTALDPNTKYGWQSNLVDLEAQELVPLIREIEQKLVDCSNLMPILPEHEPKMVNAWINVNKPNGISLQNNIGHVHPGRFWTFVYYVKADEGCGDIELTSPLKNMLGYAIPQQVYSRLTPFNSLQWQITPKPGKLIVFPGWIEHKAHSNKSENDRISIAINVDLQNLDIIQYPNKYK